jgi:hypothetical protein
MCLFSASNPWCSSVCLFVHNRKKKGKKGEKDTHHHPTTKNDKKIHQKTHQKGKEDYTKTRRKETINH